MPEPVEPYWMEALLRRFLGFDAAPPIPQYQTPPDQPGVPPWRAGPGYMEETLPGVNLSLPPGNLRSTDDRYIEDRRGRAAPPRGAYRDDEFWRPQARVVRAQTPQARAVWEYAARMRQNRANTRPPISEGLGMRPQGGTDFRDGQWRDNRGRLIAMARNEDVGFRPRNTPRNRSRNQRAV